MKVLVTRPEEDAADTVRRLGEAGHTSVVAPVLQIRFHKTTALAVGGVQAWLATSRNGVRALVHNDARRDVPLLAVGRSTAELARNSGFDQVHNADGDVGDLVDLASERMKPSAGRLVHAAGKEVAGDLLGSLEAKGFSVERQVLYAAEPVSELEADTASLLARRQIDAALFFSARSAGVFASLVTKDEQLLLALARMTAICISDRAAAALAGLSFADIRVADRPNQDALLAELD